ncbi:uncharacterized protein si:dkey-118j18.2 [Rhincodon typus]|uniref:uncharacterized protein si:dkey-118j18.2 n=1 Tax=Rhincodon typus TaxID=259920 RepID=UPI002030FC54|nr:uncharacterized protein si:dkey-118j18.2 [Rhincodon typus]
MELYWYIIVIIFIIVKIFFYICWYRSRQRQLDAYLSNPRNAQIVIVGGRAYLHQLCERQNSPMWYSWYGGQDDSSVGEPSGSLPPAPSYSQLEVPPPYEAVSRAHSDDLKPPPYTEYAAGSIEETRALSIPEGYDACSLSDAPPPYTPRPSVDAEQQDNVTQPNSQESGGTTTTGSPCEV